MLGSLFTFGWKWRVVLGLFALLFGWAAYLQLNDSNSAIWLSIYATAALGAAIGASGRRLPKRFAKLAVIGALAGSVYLAAVVFLYDAAAPMYAAAGAESVGLIDTKEGREMFGLLIVAAAFSIHLFPRPPGVGNS